MYIFKQYYSVRQYFIVCRFVSERKRQVLIEQTRFLSTVFLCSEFKLENIYSGVNFYGNIFCGNLYLGELIFLPWVPEVFLACGGNFRAGHYKDLTETGNRARKVSGTRGIIFSDRGKKAKIVKIRTRKNIVPHGI